MDGLIGGQGRGTVGPFSCVKLPYRGADKSLARPGRKQSAATEDFDFHIYNHNWRNITVFARVICAS